MRHAIATPRYVTVTSWLVVAGLGLAIGAIGAGGLMDLIGGTAAADPPSAAAAARTPVDPLDPSIGADVDADASPEALGSDQRALNPARVVSPSELPDGLALEGDAPAARLAGDGKYLTFEPTSIRLPSGRLAPVQPAKVHSDGVLDVPTNPDRVGWWTGGAQADEPYGSIVLAGHVDSARYGLGVLAEMLQMRPGQTLKVADGRRGQAYRVRTITKLPKAELSAGTDLFDQEVSHRLVMITCGGPFDERTHRYRDNVVIVADPIG